MFSFHKPKIYRSNLGCCICKAKSSSSRFTDSKKYENEFERCFRIQEKRSGEICNACVLLVKRWKKLSPENRLTKHWHHVVDARAGPGTKLTGNRRLPGPSHSGSVGSSSSSSSSSSQLTDNEAGKFRQRRPEVLPLSSSQSNNQSNNLSSSASASTRKRTGSFSKVCAIDTNVSTFTFGEPQRRNYMTVDTNYSPNSSSSALSKPQSALNSSAFESVIKRFRQRQQQQQLEAQRRLLNRQQRQLQRQQQATGPTTKQTSQSVDLPSTASVSPFTSSQPRDGSQGSSNIEHNPSSKTLEDSPKVQQHVKRQKRTSETSLTIDGCRISTLLDPTMWRKERVCCGVIFRGLYNEVVVFPKLLKPCQDRLKRQRRSVSPQPPPRTMKSGSISSCDSNTSGTGSMEQPVAEEESSAKISTAASRQMRRKGGPVDRPDSMPITRKKRKVCDTDSNLSSSSSSNKSVTGSDNGNSSSNNNQLSSPTSSSGASSSRLMLMADDEDEVGHMMVLEDVDPESSTDASASSIDSLGAALDPKKSDNALGAVG